ncbi:High-affinity nicotinic acid transporter [Sphaceloma murrayae]|uniref:High-affinity nicotinic acid transporter n=1 Tax=Sphaceloma murrayae TaxID=2082308 RepID=A0A2K1QU90_9PEZI|nr:High-affinity nicotinic acid transporter [Sphaceloma murrayae]
MGSKVDEEKSAGLEIDAASTRDQDEAFKYLTTHKVDSQELLHVDLRALRRRIDWRIMPLMFLCYLVQLLDKIALNYGAVMGLNRDLRLRGNEFSNAATLTWVAVLVGEVPSGLILNKVSASKWLGFNVIVWGIATASVAAATDYRTLLVCRIFLGLCEAAAQPSISIICGQFWTRAEQPTRFGYYYASVGAGQILGGLISYGFQFVNNPGLSGWRIMFIMLGCVTVAIGLATYFLVPESPMKASWMSEAEKSALLEHLSSNKTGVVNTKFKASQVWDLLTDPQTYLMNLMLLLLSITSGVGNSYSATLLRNVGFNPKEAAILNAPAGVVSLVGVIAGSLGVRYCQKRWLFIICAAIPAIIGGALMSFVGSRAGVLAGVCLICTNVAIMPIVFSWAAANSAGHTKRPLSLALLAGSFCVANIIGPQTFQARDAPAYIPAKVTLMAAVACGAVCSVLLAIYYRWENARRDRLYGSNEGREATEEEKWSNWTDRENKTFRYVY